jgi:hypothetical protein
MAHQSNPKKPKTPSDLGYNIQLAKRWFIKKMNTYERISLIEEKNSDVAEVMATVYSNYGKCPEGNHSNTDIILEQDGTIRTYDYFGSVVHRDDDIACIFTISANDKSEYLSMIRSNLTQEQKAFCKENGFVSIFESNDNNPDYWEEFTPTWDEFIDDVRQTIEKLNQDNFYK